MTMTQSCFWGYGVRTIGEGVRTLTVEYHIQICFKGEKKAIGNYWVAELLLKPVVEIGQLVFKEMSTCGQLVKLV